MNNSVKYRINNTIINEQEFKRYVFGTGKVLSVKDLMFLMCALERGEYVIGASYNPFSLQNVYHFKNNTFRVYNFEPGCHIEPLNITLTFKCKNMTIQEIIKVIFRFGCHDDLLINPTKEMLNLNNINK